MLSIAYSVAEASLIDPEVLQQTASLMRLMCLSLLKYSFQLN